ncbi:MAG: nitrite reductase small subunit NirD, partial [Rhodospirillaceae bacterium]|nr:nitrite reductase small subunit NirD [Rhodospirillaceae bacterium]
MSNWIKICALDDILPLGSRVVDLEEGPVAIFRTADDEVFALADSCPHKQGPISQGIVHGKSVTCPLHSWVIGFEDGEAGAPDVGCAKTFAV